MMQEIECFWCSEKFYRWYCDNCESQVTDICEACHKEAHEKGY